MKAKDYLNRYYKDKDINAIAVDDTTIKTFLSVKDIWDAPGETVDTYKLILNGTKKYTIIRTKEVR